MKDRYTLPVLLLVFVVLAAGIVAAGGLLYRSQRDSCRTEAEHNLAAVADLKVGELSRWRQERLADAGVFYENSAFSTLVRRSIERPQDSPLQEELRTWIGHVQASYRYDQITLLDATCNRWMSVPDTKNPHSTLTLQKAREAMRSGQMTFADFYPDEHTKKVYLRLFVPIFDGPPGGRPLGVLMLRIDPSVYLYPFIQRWPTPSETAETLLIRREGNEAVFLNELKFQKNTALALRIPLENTNVSSVKAALGETGNFDCKDYRGEQVLAAIRTIPDSPWRLVAKMDAAEVYAPMREWLWLTVLFVCALLLGTAAAVGFLWRQQHAALYRKKYESETKYRNLFESSCDALMTLEPPSWKFTFCNPATVEMFRAKNAQEFTTHGLWELSPERQPDGRASGEKTKEMIETAVREGSHFFEWTHKRIDGEEFPATVLLTRMEQAGKVIVQATVRDITEQKRAEEIVRRHSAEVHREYTNLQTVFDAAQVGFLLVNQRAEVTRVNDALTKMVGKDVAQMLGRQPGDGLCCIHAMMAPGGCGTGEACPTCPVRLSITRALQAGETVRGVEVRYALQVNGEAQSFWFLMIATPVTLNGVPHALLAITDITDRKRVEESLRETNEYLESLFNYANAPIIVWNPQFRITRFNHAFESLTGRRADEAIGESLEILFPPTLVESSMERIAETLRGEHWETVEISILHLDGSVRTVLWNSAPIFGPDGKTLMATIAQGQDITKRKQAEEKLLKFRAAVEQTVDGIALTDLDGHIRFVNGAWARMHGYSVDELIGRHLGIFHTKEQLETEVNPFIEQLLKTGSGEREIGHVRRNGATFPAWMSCTVLMGADQKPCGLIGTALDITERKQAEEQALIFRRFAEASGQGLGMATLQGQILYMNQTLCRMLDEDNLEDVYKKGFPEYYLPEFRERLLNEVLPKVMSGGQWVGELALVSTKGKQTPTIENFFLIHDEEGRPLRLADVVTDITERKQMEDDLHKAKDEAEAANRAKSEFLANMSHEIRTPMTAILGYADLMLDENVGRDTREHVAVIKRNGEHLLKVIGDILDLSKIEAGKLQIEPTRCWPVQVVAEVVSLMRTQAAARQLELKMELTGPLPETVLTDPLRLRQVLVNLVGNAIKFTDQGEVRLAVRLVACGKGTVPFSSNENRDSPPDRGRLSLCFDVTDTGVGMNEEQIGKLFKPFSQVDNSSTRKFGGTGLGLCISKYLAEALGGNIEVRSEPGKGSTFSVTIDPGLLDGTRMIQNAQEALLDRPPSATAATPDKIALHGRILQAEDGLDNQQLISLLLRNAGAQVTAVENGQLAVEAALAARDVGEPFDVILMDMQMPVLDGYEATRQLRKRGYTGPIVALTASAMVGDCQKCLAAGCDDYLPKPFQHRALLETMARHITTEKEDKPLLPDYAQPTAASASCNSSE